MRPLTPHAVRRFAPPPTMTRPRRPRPTRRGSETHFDAYCDAR